VHTTIVSRASRQTQTNAMIVACDRRNSAVHEAGHFVVGQHFGIRNHFAMIGPNRKPGTVLLTERSWTGQYGAHRKYLNRLSQRRRMILGLSGALAEEVWLNRSKDNDEWCWLGWLEDMLLDENFMSPTDWDLVGEIPGNWSRALVRAAEETVRLLQGPLWQPLVTTARALIRKGSVATAVA
jgi:hypothetical protein